MNRQHANLVWIFLPGFAILLWPGLPGRVFSVLNKKLLIQTITAYLAALLVWTVLFYRNPYLGNVLVDIHGIFTATLLAYLLIRLLISPSAMELVKVFIRTLFRVWLLIFITFAISRSMDRVGSLLSMTFTLGYIEGLLDISKWLESRPSLPSWIPADAAAHKVNHALATLILMCIVHIGCALAVLGVYLFFR